MNLPIPSTELLDSVRQGADHLVSRARRRAFVADAELRDAVIERGIRVVRSLSKVTEPVTKRGWAPDVAARAEEAVESVVHEAIPEYDHLNVRQVDDRLRLIDDVTTLLVIAAYERDSKGRSTVARSVERQLARLEPGVTPAPEWASPTPSP